MVAHEMVDDILPKFSCLASQHSLLAEKMMSETYHGPSVNPSWGSVGSTASTCILT